MPTRVTGLDGRMVLSSHAVVPRLGWIVFVELPVREVLAPVFTSLYQTLALLALGILLAIVLGALLASRLLVPIKLLQAGAQRLGEGDLSQRIPVTSGDEIGTLARRFNDMAGKIQEAQETLEAKVDARTQQLTKSLEDLRAAQDRLVQTEKLASLGQLTAGIAHEIKNPLNFVNNFAELSSELVEELNATLEPSADALPEEVRRDVADITGLLKDNLGRVVQHGKRADSIVRNMLLHARHGVEERREVDLNALVDEALNLAYHGARAEKAGFNITLKRDYDPAAGKVSLFPQEFTRVLLNLIGNGFHAASKRLAREQEPGGDATFEPTLTVTTRSRGERVRIKIRDNGTGIPDDIRARIFEPFFTTKPAGEGTGLGLSISHDIIAKQHGGKIDVMSKPGEFTEFFITRSRQARNAGGDT
jgi:signal transduction histidine kinase